VEGELFKLSEKQLLPIFAVNRRINDNLCSWSVNSFHDADDDEVRMLCDPSEIFKALLDSFSAFCI